MVQVPHSFETKYATCLSVSQFREGEVAAKDLTTFTGEINKLLKSVISAVHVLKEANRFLSTDAFLCEIVPLEQVPSAKEKI